MHVVATVGLHGSASTWVYNVARETLIAAHGEAGVLAIYTDDGEQVPDAAAIGGRRVVVKSHHGSASLDTWLETTNATMLLSLRDPRDAALSVAQRFGVKLPNAIEWLLPDCARMVRLLERGHPVFRYEDGFFADPEAATRVASLLGETLAADRVAAIAARYATEAVRAFTRTVEALPPDRLVRWGDLVFDDRTQIHHTHIGDTKIGKWRDLPEPERAGMTEQFRLYLKAFGYPD